MNVNYNNGYTFKMKNNIGSVSKRDNIFANNSMPEFGSSARLSQNLVRGAVKSSTFAKIRQVASNVIKQTGDDVARTNVFKKALINAKSMIKKGIAYCVAAITGSVLFVREMGDDIKFRMKTKIKPVSLMKDVAIKVKKKAELMNQVNYYEVEKLSSGGPGVKDILDRSIDGASKALGVEIKKSGKSYLMQKAQALFSRSAS